MFEEFAIAENGDVVGTASPTPGQFNIGFTDTGFYLLRDGIWHNYNTITNSTMRSQGLNSLFTVAVSGPHYFFGTWGRGFIRFDADSEEITRYNTLNSALPGFTDDSPYMVVSSITADQTDPDAMWLISKGSANRSLGRYSIASRTVETFARLPQLTSDSRYSKIFSDSFGQLWITLENSTEAGRGVLVVKNPEGGPDAAFRLTTNIETGNLPHEKANAIIQDRRGEVWIGTDRGIARFLFPDRIVTGSAAERRAQALINQDTTAADRVLLRDVRVTAMAVDANNQKWIGSDGDGLYLIEEAGREVIRHFTIENSPLPSNVIQSVTVNPATGEVFISTQSGFAVYQALEREGAVSMKSLRLYPNPYSYSDHAPNAIVIEDLADNATVSILSTDGRLVRRFTTRGGRAEWDGLDEDRRRVPTGVYFVVATGNSNDQVARGRVVIVR
jgi:hypothetical protein